VVRAQSAEQTKAIRDLGMVRSRDFSWDKHVEELLRLAHRLYLRQVSGSAH